MKGMIIGIDGPIGSGKTAVSDVLFDAGFYPLNFADPLKGALCRMLDEPAKNFEDRELKEAVIEDLGITRRDLMVSLGHDWGRNVVEGGLWLKLFKRNVLPLIETGLNVVVADVRYDDAAELIRGLGGVICHVSRPGVERKDHPSEAGVRFMPGDVAIINDGSLKGMRDHVMVMIDSLMGVSI